MAKEFSRVRELFYRTVGEQAETADINGLFSHAFRTFQERYLVSNTGVSPKVFRYKAEKGTEALTLRLLSRYGRAELTAIEIVGATSDLDAVLEGLWGEVELAYNGLGISNLPSSLHFLQKPLEKIKTAQTQVIDIDQASFYLAPGPEENILKNVRWYIPQNDNASHPTTERFHPLYNLADLIRLQSSYYRDHNPSQELINESCEIRPRKHFKHDKEGEFNFRYNLSVANDLGMPVSMLPKVEQKFRLVQDNFGILSFRRVRIEDGGVSS